MGTLNYLILNYDPEFMPFILLEQLEFTEEELGFPIDFTKPENSHDGLYPWLSVIINDTTGDILEIEWITNDEALVRVRDHLPTFPIFSRL